MNEGYLAKINSHNKYCGRLYREFLW